MKLKMVKFRDPVDVRGNNDSGCSARPGVDLTRAPNGDVIITWEASGGLEARQILVGHSNIKFSEPLKWIDVDALGPKGEAKK